MQDFIEKTETQQKDRNTEKTTRNYKDSLFVDLFAKCPEAKKNFISLYNALHGTKLKPSKTKIEPVVLGKTIYTGRYNDVSMLVDGKIIVLVEHQSTINENMPLRFLEYVSRIYEKLIPLEKRYAHRAISLPRPEFYVFYNGIQEYPAEKTLKLSGTFLKTAETDFSLELSVKVYNINRKEFSSVLEKCPPLRGYAMLVQYAKKAKSAGIWDWLTHAVQRCIKEGILVEYLKQNSTEVINMLIADYDYDMDIKVQRQEAFEEAKYETAKNLFELNLNPEQIAKATSLPLEKIIELKKQTQTAKA